MYIIFKNIVIPYESIGKFQFYLYNSRSKVKLFEIIFSPTFSKVWASKNDTFGIVKLAKTGVKRESIKLTL